LGPVLSHCKSEKHLDWIEGRKVLAGNVGKPAKKPRSGVRIRSTDLEGAAVAAASSSAAAATEVSAAAAAEV